MENLRCPVIILSDTKKLHASLRRLGKAQAGCKLCAHTSCQLQEQINQQVEDAIRAVNTEWKIYA